MLKLIGTKNTVAVTAMSKPLAMITKGTLILWELVRSCFGSGMWVSKKPWIGKEGWRNTKRF